MDCVVYLLILVFTTQASGEDKFSVTAGSCETSGNCFRSPNYPSAYGSNETCTIKVQSDIGWNEQLLSFAFDTEFASDTLTIGGKTYSGAVGPQAVSITTGCGSICGSNLDEFTWRSDGSTQKSGFNICLVQKCTRRNGLVINDESCLCGTSHCTDETGLYCDAERSVCATVQKCTHTNRLMINDESCLCGTSHCTDETGLYCDAERSMCTTVPYFGQCSATQDFGYTECACGNNVCDATTGHYCYEGNICGEKEILIAVAHVGSNGCMSISPELQFWINMDPKAHIVTKLIPSGKMTFTDLAVSDNTVLGTTFNKVVVSGTLDVTHMTTNQLNIDYYGELSDVAVLLKTIQDSINTL